MSPPTLSELVVVDAKAWSTWLAKSGSTSPGVWLVLAKKDTTSPTSLRYDQALKEALCWGWIDGQIGRRDDATYLTRFTPRRAKSAWSARNVGIVERLVAEGRMQPPGLAAVEAAKADGRWERAYAGQANMPVPDDLTAELAKVPAAQAMWDVLTASNRFAILYRLHHTKPDARAARIADFVGMLARGETVHPQRARPRAAHPQEPSS